MICLNKLDTLEGGASVDAVVDYTVHGLVSSTFTQIAQGQLSDTDPSVLYTAGASISIVSIILVNTHAAAVTVNLYLDPANAVTPRRMIPKAVSLGIGYSLHFDGQRCTVLDASGRIQTGVGGIAIDPIWVAAGDLVQGTGSDTATILSLGAANLKLFVNAAGNLSEWANGIKIGTFTVDTATDDGGGIHIQAVAGVGFKPSNIILIVNVPATAQVSIGFSNGTLDYSIFNYHHVGANQWAHSVIECVTLYQGAGIHYRATISTLGVDGFTLTWIKTGAKIGVATIHYLAFR